MNTSESGLFAIVRHEGIVPAPYIDAVGVWTFGVGHAETSGIAPNPREMPRGMPADMDAAIQQSFDLFRAKIKPFEDVVRAAVTVPLAQHEFDALVSLCFNIGPAALRRSSVVRHLNAGNRQAAADAFGAWNKGRVNGELKALPGLTSRRAEEREMFLTARYPSGPVPIYEVNAQGRLGKVIRRMTEAEVRRALRQSPAPQRPAQRPNPSKPAFSFDAPAPNPTEVVTPQPDSLLVRILKALGIIKR